MGIGAALVMPGTLSILATVFPPAERPKAITIWASVAGGSVAVSITWSGAMLESFWWGAIFLGMAAVAALSVVGVTGLLYGFIQAPDGRVGRGADPGRLRDRYRRPGRVRRLGATPHAPDARHRLLRRTAFQPGLPLDRGRLPRPVRHVLRLHPVPPTRARLLAAGRRPVRAARRSRAARRGHRTHHAAGHRRDHVLAAAPSTTTAGNRGWSASSPPSPTAPTTSTGSSKRSAATPADLSALLPSADER